MVFPGVHYTMGGIWVDSDTQATNVPGIYAAGECEYQYHGANRLGANSLVSCIYGGMVAGPASVKYGRSLDNGCESAPSSVFEREQKRQQGMNDALVSQQGDENPITIWKEMGDWMTEHVTVTRKNAGIERTDSKIQELQERFKKMNLVGPHQMVKPNAFIRSRASRYAYSWRGSSRSARWRETNPAALITNRISRSASTPTG